MVKFYVMMIKKGKVKIEDVPSLWYNEVLGTLKTEGFIK